YLDEAKNLLTGRNWQAVWIPRFLNEECDSMLRRVASQVLSDNRDGDLLPGKEDDSINKKTRRIKCTESTRLRRKLVVRAKQQHGARRGSNRWSTTRSRPREMPAS